MSNKSNGCSKRTTARVLMRFGKNVRRARKRRSLTQAELAQSLGLVRTSIVNIEAGRQAVTVATAWMIARALRLPLARLLSGL